MANRHGDPSRSDVLAVLAAHQGDEDAAADAVLSLLEHRPLPASTPAGVVDRAGDARLFISVVVSYEGGRMRDGATVTHAAMPEGMPADEVWTLADRHALAIRAEADDWGDACPR